MGQMAKPQKKILRRAALAGFLLTGTTSVDAQSPPSTQVDILIKNGRVVDPASYIHSTIR
jgi:hypothetical protein